jgi:hypothetical protein
MKNKKNDCKAIMEMSPLMTIERNFNLIDCAGITDITQKLAVFGLRPDRFESIPVDADREIATKIAISWIAKLILERFDEEKRTPDYLTALVEAIMKDDSLRQKLESVFMNTIIDEDPYITQLAASLVMDYDLLASVLSKPATSPGTI